MDLSRTKKVFANIENLKSKHVAIFGLGGVGGYVAEALVRSGAKLLWLTVMSSRRLI